MPQGDCDCACPMPMPAGTALPIAGEPLRLHPQTRFLSLSSDTYLLYIPSTLAGVVVNARLRDTLLTLPKPAPFEDLCAGGLPRSLLQRCAELGFLVGERPAAPLPASETLVAWLHVTNACNLRCTYCYLDKTDEPMTDATGRAAVDAIVRSALYNGYRALKLKFAGGEASLNFPLVWDLLAYARAQAAAHALELDAVLLSNGVGLTRATVQRIKAERLRLMISLDGLAAVNDAQRLFANGRGSFRTVAGTIERALAAGLQPDISVTVSGQSAAGLAELVDWLLERDLAFGLNFFRENDCAAPHAVLKLVEQKIVDGMLAAFRTIEARLPRRSLLGAIVDRANLAAPHTTPCGAGYNYMVVDQRGGVAKCHMEIERPVASVRDADPLALIRADTIGVRNLPVQQRQGCRDCEWQLWCAGGCPVATFRATGRYDLRSPNCGIYQALYPEALRLEGLRILKYGERELFA
jgi:uncharacterized protein